MSRKNFIILALIVLAIFLRLYRWDEKFSFNAEYNYKLWPMKHIVIDHKPTLIGIEAVSYLHHVHYPPFFLYIFSPILYVGNLNPASIELFLIFLSGVTTYVFFLLGKEIRDNNLGYVVALLYAVSFQAERSDRFIWVVGLILLITSVLLLRLLKLFRNKSITIKESFIIGILLGLGLCFHYQAMALVVSVLLFMTFLRKKGAQFKHIIFLFIGILLFFLPLIIFDFRHDFYNLKGVLLLLNYSSETLSSERRIVSTFAATASLLLGLFLPQPNPSAWITDSLIFTVPSVLLVFYLLFRFSRQKELRSWYYFQILLVVVSLVTFAFLKNNFNYYLFILQPVFIVIIARLFVVLWKKQNTRILVTSCLTVFVFVNIYSSLTFSFQTSWKKQVEAVNHIFSSRQRDNVSVYFASFPSEEYSFLFYFIARKRNIDFSNVIYYEPWQTENDAEFVINPKSTEKGNEKIFGNLKILQREKI